MNGLRRGLTFAVLGLLGVSAWLSNSVLFRQTVTGKTELTRTLASHLGPWELIEESQPSPGEVQGLETTDIIKRTYSNGRNYMELVVAYIAHSSRKSAHAQEACLRGAGAMVGSIEDIGLDDGGVSAKLISIDIREKREWVCYWYKIGDTHTARYLQSSLMMFLGGIIGQKHQGASLVRLLTPEVRGESRKDVEARLDDFTRYLVPELHGKLP